MRPAILSTLYKLVHGVLKDSVCNIIKEIFNRFFYEIFFFDLLVVVEDLTL